LLLFLGSLKNTAYAKLNSKGIIESQSNIFVELGIDEHLKQL